MRVRINDFPETSYYRFENDGDGTMYEVHIMPCENGGLYGIEGNVSNNTLWIWFPEDRELRLLAGPNNEYTRRAMMKIFWHHWNKWVPQNRDENAVI